MKKFISFLVMFFVLAIANGSFAQSPQKAKVVIVNMTDSTASHVYGDRFNAAVQAKDIFDYGKYSVESITKHFDNEGFEVIEIGAPLYFRTAALLNFVGAPTQKTKMWLADLQTKHDADFLILINRKFVPDEKQAERFLDKQQYGLATYLYAPDVLSVFSFVGYYIFSVNNMKSLAMNPNHEKYVITDIVLDAPMNSEELKNIPSQYLEMATDQLKNIADTRNLEVERVVLNYLDR